MEGRPASAGSPRPPRGTPLESGLIPRHPHGTKVETEILKRNPGESPGFFFCAGCHGRLVKESLANLPPDVTYRDLTYEFLGVKRVWRWTKERMQERFGGSDQTRRCPGPKALS